MLFCSRPVQIELSPPTTKIYRQEKLRLVMELRESSDRAVRVMHVKCRMDGQQGEGTSDVTIHPACGPRQARKRGRLPEWNRRASEHRLWHKGSKALDNMGMCLKSGDQLGNRSVFQEKSVAPPFAQTWFCGPRLEDLRSSLS